MAAGKSTSVPHDRTRAAHATETAEDYVEAIAEILAEQGTCRVTDLAKHFGVSHVTVSRILGRLQQAGWVYTKPYYPVELTEGGRKLAQESKRRHEIVYHFLLALGLDPQTASIDSEGIEHHVSRKTLDLMKAFTDKAPPRRT